MSTLAISIFIWSSLATSSFVSVMFLINLLFFRKTNSACAVLAESDGTGSERREVSVLIPARNEALRIGPLLDSVLASQGVQCEICVLDDESQDDTAAIVLAYSKLHPHVRLLRGSPIPAGWSGKQYACYQLAQQATHDEMIFLDADVQLTKHALQRAIDQRRRDKVDLLSGFPRQRVLSVGEQLLIPLIHLILLCFLPFVLMRWTRMVGAAAGCGQFFLTTKQAYRSSGGHSSIKQSLHDGIMLPRAYRRLGLKTDLCDASDLATCRMYTSFAETWSGLLKNASEGFAKMPVLPIITLLMLLAFVCPTLSLIALALGLIDATWLPIVLTACALSYMPRLVCCHKFDRAWLACIFNPISILLFLTIQWTAWFRKSRGRGVQWRQRDYGVVPS